MTCNNIDSDANVFAQNCIILNFVHCAVFCLEFISLCMYVCMRASCMFILHASSACTVKSRVEAELTYKPVADKSRNTQRACRVQADSA